MLIESEKKVESFRGNTSEMQQRLDKYTREIEETHTENRKYELVVM